jgi:hypothetical protein
MSILVCLLFGGTSTAKQLTVNGRRGAVPRNRVAIGATGERPRMSSLGFDNPPDQGHKQDGDQKQNGSTTLKQSGHSKPPCFFVTPFRGVY